MFRSTHSCAASATDTSRAQRTCCGATAGGCGCARSSSVSVRHGPCGRRGASALQQPLVTPSRADKYPVTLAGSQQLRCGHRIAFIASASLRKHALQTRLEARRRARPRRRQVQHQKTPVGPRRHLRPRVTHMNWRAHARPGACRVPAARSMGPAFWTAPTARRRRGPSSEGLRVTFCHPLFALLCRLRFECA